MLQVCKPPGPEHFSSGTSLVSYSANMMFFGCRSKCADYYFSSEWAVASRTGCLILHTAFSRDQSHKVYVQHRLEEEGEEVWRWISQKKAHIFIAG